MTMVMEEIDLDGMIAAKSNSEPIMVGNQVFSLRSRAARSATSAFSNERLSQVNREFSMAFQIEGQKWETKCG